MDATCVTAVQILQRVEGQVLVDRGEDGVAVGGQHQRQAVSGNAGDMGGAGNTGAVLDDDLLAPFGGQLLRDRARQDIGHAAGRERHDDPDHLAWVRGGLSVGGAGSGRQRGGAGDCEAGSLQKMAAMHRVFLPGDDCRLEATYAGLLAGARGMASRIVGGLVRPVLQGAPLMRGDAAASPMGGASPPPRRWRSSTSPSRTTYIFSIAEASRVVPPPGSIRESPSQRLSDWAGFPSLQPGHAHPVVPRRLIGGSGFKADDVHGSSLLAGAGPQDHAVARRSQHGAIGFGRRVSKRGRRRSAGSGMAAGARWRSREPVRAACQRSRSRTSASVSMPT